MITCSYTTFYSLTILMTFLTCLKKYVNYHANDLPAPKSPVIHGTSIYQIQTASHVALNCAANEE